MTSTYIGFCLISSLTISDISSLSFYFCVVELCVWLANKVLRFLTGANLEGSALKALSFVFSSEFLNWCWVVVLTKTVLSLSSPSSQNPFQSPVHWISSSWSFKYLPISNLSGFEIRYIITDFTLSGLYSKSYSVSCSPIIYFCNPFLDSTSTSNSQFSSFSSSNANLKRALILKDSYYFD